ncbi:hypothetical protein AVBRAN9333_07670 [Campylobacter sp. RM9333]|uniref:hypothetical protein n=1 Tax=Campylobacter sp. RM9333 TaxID=2735731 RepID=UPI001D5316F4|nr:hypothetical protein [Campylobacter sp. RM9333]
MRRFITDIIFIILSITFMIYLFMVYFADFDSLSYGLLYIFIISLHITFIILYLCFILSEENLKVYDNFISEDNQANIETIVNHFNQNKTKHSIALLGKWGCGKTYLWEHFIRPKIAIKYELITANLAKSMAIVCGLFLLACLNDDLIKLIRTYFCVSYFDFFKPIFLFPILLGLFIYIRIFSSYKNSIIYISLYGKNDFKSAIDEIYQKSQDSKDYLIRLLNGLSSKITGIENLFYKLDEGGFENKIICIDDIERRPKSMGLEDVFGLVSHLKEIKKCHVLAIFGEGIDEISFSYMSKDIEKQYKKTNKNCSAESIKEILTHTFYEKTFSKTIELYDNEQVIINMIKKSTIKLNHIGVHDIINYIIHTDEYLLNGYHPLCNIRKFKEMLSLIEQGLNSESKFDFSKDYISYFYRNIFDNILYEKEISCETASDYVVSEIFNNPSVNLNKAKNILIYYYKFCKHFQQLDKYVLAVIPKKNSFNSFRYLHALLLVATWIDKKDENIDIINKQYDCFLKYLNIKNSNIIKVLNKYRMQNIIGLNTIYCDNMKNFFGDIKNNNTWDREFDFKTITLQNMLKVARTYEYVKSCQTITNIYVVSTLELLQAIIDDGYIEVDDIAKRYLKIILGK